jgi:hypothetical protein
MIKSKRREAPTSLPAYPSHLGDCKITTNISDLSHKKDDSFRICEFSSGIVHGLQANAFFGDKDLYYALTSIFKSERRFDFNINTYECEFFSKKSGFLNDAGNGFFEYVANLKDTESLRKLTLVFSPRLGDVFYGRKNRKAWRISERQGEGVEVKIKSSYNTPTEIERTIQDAFNLLDLSRFFDSWNKEESYIITSENHLRYHEKKEEDIAKVMWVIFFN